MQWAVFRAGECREGGSGAPGAPVGFAAGSLFAAMLLALPGTALADEAAADSSDGPEITVIGHGEKIDLPTVNRAVIDTPQTVNVVAPEVLKQRQVTTLSDALRNVAGVTTSVGEGGVVNGDQFFIRGQPARDDIFTDGLRDFGAFTRDAFNYEAVEVLKGSSSTALGRGVAGGAINTESKRASTQDSFAATFGAGTDGYYRVTADANKALGPTTGLRLNFMAHRNDTPDREGVFSHRWGFASSLGIGIDQDTRLDLIFFHQEETSTVDYGVPVAVTTDPDDIERPVTELGVRRSSFYGFRGDLDHAVVNTLTARLSHRANDWLSFTSDTKLGVYKRTFRQTIPTCPAACGDALLDGNPATSPIAVVQVRGQFRQTTRGIQNVTTAEIEKPIGGMRNELVLGWDVSWQDNKREDDVRPGSGNVNQPLFSPSLTNAPIYPAVVYQTRKNSATDLSLFADERLWLLPTLSLEGGLRYQHFVSPQSQTAFLTNVSAPLTSCNGVDGVVASCLSKAKPTYDLWSPKASLIWEPSSHVSVYASYSRAAVPPGNSVSNGAFAVPATGGVLTTSDLAPERTQTYDVGVKLGLFHNRLLVQSAVYQIDRDNAQEVDPLTQLLVASADPKQRLRGFELGVSGAVTPELLLTANYSFVDARIRQAVTGGVIDTAAIGKQVRYVPRHSASLWASYKPLDGRLRGLEVGAGANYQSQVVLNNANTQVTPAYVAFDALVAYSFGKFRVAVNGYNLGNKLYYAQVNGGRAVPAPGRSVLVTFGVGF